LSLVIVVWDVELNLFDFPEVDLKVKANKSKDGNLPEIDNLASVTVFVGYHVKVIQNVLRWHIEVYLGFPFGTLLQTTLRSR
jgi:hypothetical protein